MQFYVGYWFLSPPPPPTSHQPAPLSHLPPKVFKLIHGCSCTYYGSCCIHTNSYPVEGKHFHHHPTHPHHPSNPPSPRPPSPTPQKVFKLIHGCSCIYYSSCCLHTITNYYPVEGKHLHPPHTHPNHPPTPPPNTPPRTSPFCTHPFIIIITVVYLVGSCLYLLS